MILKRLIILMSLLASQMSYSEIVMPVLYGWYTGIESDYQDTCLENHYNYKNLAEGTAFQLAQKTLLPKKNHDNCYWESITLEPSPNGTFMPEDFPGSSEQWRELSKDPSYRTQRAIRLCNDLDDITYDSVSMDIFPAYRCPEGSYNSLDRDALELGCTTKPLGCYGDIVGRNLDTVNNEGEDLAPTAIKNLGHIGLTVPSINGVTALEVLHDDVVIQEHSLEDFKKMTVFWGEKYGAPSNDKIDVISGINIVVAAEEQKKCATKYTLGWSFSPCVSGKNAKFRCDSFVYYAYLKGANIDLGYKPLWTYPSTIFKSMNSCRAQSGELCRSDMPDPVIVEDVKSYVLKPTFLAAQDVQTILSKDKLDIGKLDIASYAYVSSKDESRDNKINFLWDQIIKHEFDSVKFSYLTDILSELEPIEKTDEIISHFNKIKDNDKRLIYLTLLLDAITPERVNGHPNEESKAKSFLIDILKNNQNDALLKTAIVNYPDHFIDENTYSIMSDRLEELKMDRSKVFNEILIDSNFWYHWLWLAKKYDGFDASWIDKLNQKSQEYKDDDQRSTTLFSQKIHEAFMFGLKGREEQDLEFRESQTAKKIIPSSLAEDDPFVPDEIKSTLRLLKEASEKRNREHKS